MGKSVTSLRRAIVAIALCAMAFTLCGCVFSDTITERIYDSSEDSLIDYDLEPVLVNSINAQQVSDKLPRLAQDDSDSYDDSEAGLPVFTKGVAPVETPASTPVQNPNVEDNSQASGAPTGQGEAAAPQPDSGAQVGEGGEDDEGGDEGPGGDGQGEGEGDPTDEGDGNGDGPSDEGDDQGRKPGGSGDFYSDVPSYDDPEIPDSIDEVVAFGNNAVIVAMLSGTESSTALLGCDAATLGKTSALLAGRGMGTVKAIDHHDGDMMSAAAFDALVNDVAPDLVFVTEGKNPFTEDQLVVLSDNLISVYTLPELTSDARIRFAVQLIGRTLDQGGVAGAADRMNAYLARCDSITANYTGLNGGITGGYDFEEDLDVATNAKVIATLYIDEWDEATRFLDPYGYLDSSQGVALATLGTGTSPLNYYLSVGGVLNTAASQEIRDQGLQPGLTGIVWQFPRDLLGFQFSRWSPTSKATFDLSAHVVTGGLFGANLLCYSTGSVFGLGGSTFPAVVTKNQRLANFMVQNSKEPGDLYYPYPTINPKDEGRTVGYFTDKQESMYIESCIGLDGGDSSVLNGSPFNVYVNPKGLCQADSKDSLCSWSGGSPESILEASWAYYRFRGGSKQAFRDEVSAFYSDFYGYALASAELDAIEAGAVE